MTSENISTKIKTFVGANIKTLDSSIKELLQSDTIEVPDAIILHVGINNVSEGQDHASIINDYTNLIQLLKTKLSRTKIIMSSILPMKNIKLTASKIGEINKSLLKYCEQNGHGFIDNTDQFQNSKHLYHDEVHLNMRCCHSWNQHEKSLILSP